MRNNCVKAPMRSKEKWGIQNAVPYRNALIPVKDIVLLVNSQRRYFNGMQITGSAGLAMGDPLIWDEYSGYFQALHSY